MTVEWTKCAHCGTEHPRYRDDATGRLLDKKSMAAAEIELHIPGLTYYAKISLHYKDAPLLFSELPNAVIQQIKNEAAGGNRQAQDVLGYLSVSSE